jgi:molybdopterin-guanine dinucleotide biosynthesis protein A
MLANSSESFALWWRQPNPPEMAEIHISRFSGALVSKGFCRSEGKHHTMFHLVANEKRTSIRTRLSHGQRKVDDWLQRQIARELHISKRDLLRFIDCEISQQEYVGMMIEKGHILL